MTRKRAKKVALTLDQLRALLVAHFEGQMLPPKFVRHLKRVGWIERYSEELTDRGKHQLNELRRY